MCVVKSTGVRRELCWEQEQGAVLGREAAVSAAPSRLALQVAPGSLQACQVLAPSEAFLETIASSASICLPVTVYFQGLGSLPSGARLASGGQNRLNPPLKEPTG